MELALDRPPRAQDQGALGRSALVDTPLDSRPEHSPGQRGLKGAATTVVVCAPVAPVALVALVALVLACGAVAGAWVNGIGLPAPLQALLGRAGQILQGNRVTSVDEKVGINCFTSGDGEYLVYVDLQGTKKIVESPAQVPAQFRDTVRCARLQH